MNDIYKLAFSNKVPTSVAETRLRRLEVGELRVRRGSVQATAGKFGRLNLGNLVPNDINAAIDLRQTDVTKLGSVPPRSVDAFAVVQADTYATIYYDGTNGSSQIQIRRTDGTVLVIPPNSITISGLTALTKYYMLPFWSTDAEGDGCGYIGWVAGTAGSPMFCTTTVTLDQIQQQTLQGREALANPAITFTTLAAASPPAAPSYSGGGAGNAGTNSGNGSGGMNLA